MSMSHQDKAQACLLLAIKAKDLLSSVFLSCEANPLHLCPWCPHVGFGGKGNVCKHADALSQESHVFYQCL